MTHGFPLQLIGRLCGTRFECGLRSRFRSPKGRLLAALLQEAQISFMWRPMLSTGGGNQLWNGCLKRSGVSPEAARIPGRLRMRLGHSSFGFFQNFYESAARQPLNAAAPRGAANARRSRGGPSSFNSAKCDKGYSKNILATPQSFSLMPNGFECSDQYDRCDHSNRNSYSQKI
jgi:hypothetical protein